MSRMVDVSEGEAMVRVGVARTDALSITHKCLWTQ